MMNDREFEDVRDDVERVSKVCDVIKLLGSIEYRDNTTLLHSLACLLDSVHSMRKQCDKKGTLAEFAEQFGLVDPEDDSEEALQEAQAEAIRDFDKKFSRLRAFMDIFWQQADPNA